MQRKYRGTSLTCVLQGMPCGHRGWDTSKVLPGHALEMFKEEAQVKPQNILREIPKLVEFSKVWMHTEIMKLQQLVSSLGCWGTQKLGIH